MSLIRNPSVAGQFYPADPVQLQAMVHQYLVDEAVASKPKAIIAPHAGYIYSGEVAGKVYSCLKKFQTDIQRVILFGPAHRLAFQGIATSKVDFFKTPLANIAIDKQFIELAIESHLVSYHDAAFNGEHCLEVQLPFLQSVLQNFTIAPFLVSDCASQQVAKLIQLLWQEQNTLIVISSDLSHFLPYQQCVVKDQQTAQAIKHMRYQDLHYDDACGRTPIQGLLRVIEDKGWFIQEIARNNSGDTEGSRDRVVGYGGWVIL